MADRDCMSVCPVCGTEFEQRKGKGCTRRYCGEACQANAPRSPVLVPCAEPGCTNLARSNASAICQTHYSFRWKADRLSSKRAELAAVPCSTCGRPVGSALRKRYCSKACRDSGDVTRSIRRAVGRAYMCAKRARVVVQFDPHEVLERDGWRCRLCGVRTPKGHRGKNLPSSPELDHIVPLSKGGEHTPWNTQCLCRKCNRSKSDKAIGQLALAIAWTASSRCCSR